MRFWTWKISWSYSVTILLIVLLVAALARTWIYARVLEDRFVALEQELATEQARKREIRQINLPVLVRGRWVTYTN
jgi:uncharacterized protein YlxW (UPF0749 family)